MRRFRAQRKLREFYLIIKARKFRRVGIAAATKLQAIRRRLKARERVRFVRKQKFIDNKQRYVDKRAALTFKEVKEVAIFGAKGPKVKVNTARLKKVRASTSSVVFFRATVHLFFVFARRFMQIGYQFARAFNVSLHLKATKDKAAIAIQRTWHKYKATKKVKAKRRARRQKIKEHQAQLTLKAAMMLQRVRRGFLARRRLRLEGHTSIAVRLQYMWRKFHRRRVHHAAAKIQSMFRSRKFRQVFKLVLQNRVRGGFHCVFRFHASDQSLTS